MEDLQKIFFFDELNDDEYKLLKKFSKKKEFQKGSILFYEKEKPKALIFLIEGVLKVYKTDSKNNEITIHRFKPVNLIAEMPLFENMPYPASAIFDTDGSIIEIDFEKFKEIFLSNPSISLSFFKSFSKKIRQLENVIDRNIVLDATARVAKYMYENNGDIDMKHKHLAKYLNMTPETLSRIFRKLVKSELLEKEKECYIIKNEEKLRTFFE